jgi:AcrR family transcriptional regulator
VTPPIPRGPAGRRDGGRRLRLDVAMIPGTSTERTIGEMSDPERSRLVTPFERFFKRIPRQKRSHALVDALVTALEQMPRRSEDPLEWSLESLVERAGVGIGSFYEYFTNKQNLLAALLSRVTQRNFDAILGAFDGEAPDSLERTLSILSRRVAEVYFREPTTTRLAVAATVRLGLLPAVHGTRDLFAAELAKRTHRFFPGVEQTEVETTARMISDSVIGMVVAELDRTEAPDVELWAGRFEQVALAICVARHGPRGVSAPP